MSDVFAQFTNTLRNGLVAIPSAPDHVVFENGPNLNIPAAVSTLALQGIVLVRDFIAHSEALRLATEVNGVLAAVSDMLNAEQTIETDTFAVNFELERFKTFPLIAAHHKPVFNIRHGRTSGAPEAGFVDLFKPDVLIPALAPYRAALETGLPAQILTHFPSQRYRPTSLNLYINDSVTHQRDFHIDDESHQVKAFVYLTDVLTREDGPYCYIPGSHQEKHIKALNKVYNTAAGRPRTDMSLADPATAIACLAPAGTLILSIQSGLHRGLDQVPGARRLMLTELFEPG
ncbi:MAG: hypothetical protein JNM81_08295 [Rhodospirillaceae bacterium]|nr:hypothetical protein [Rhodospirillaceae bacterium]